MDLLITKLDGNSTSLSSIGLQVIDIKETSPSISRISKTFDGRNGSLDYGGRHVDKKLMVSAMYSATSMSEDAKIEGSINGLTSQIEPFYITKFLNDGSIYDFERPGQETGNLKFANGNEDYKRYKVYRSDTNSPEFKGKIGDKLISTIDLEFTTVGLPYGESMPRDLDVKPNVPYYSENLVTGTSNELKTYTGSGWGNSPASPASETYGAGRYYASAYIENTTPVEMNIYVHVNGHAGNFSGTTIAAGQSGIVSCTFDIIEGQSLDSMWVGFTSSQTESYTYKYKEMMVTRTPSSWSPSPSDPGYNEWYIDTYYNTNNLFIPYAGTAPCSQLEQSFYFVVTAKEKSDSGFTLTVDDQSLIVTSPVVVGDVYTLAGMNNTRGNQNINNKTNAGYFVLRPNAANKVVCSISADIQIKNLCDLYI